MSAIRIKDIKATRSELKKTRDPEKQIKLRRLLQRLNDQHKDGKRSKVEKEKREKQREEIEQEYREGRQPHFRNKCKLITHGNGQTPIFT